jgi:hypothetical protein
VARQAVHPGQGITIVVFTTLPRLLFIAGEALRNLPPNQGDFRGFQDRADGVIDGANACLTLSRPSI